MGSRFQAGVLAASPSYPSSIAWSQENLIAVAAGHLVIILNPGLPLMPRGIITVQALEPETYPIGRITREDLFCGDLLPIALSRDRRPCVRSVSWSSLGMAPNFGCLLAVCTVEGSVKIYRPPHCDFSAEWKEVIDISDKLYDYLVKNNFGELSSEIANKELTVYDPSKSSAADMQDSISQKRPKQRKNVSNQDHSYAGNGENSKVHSSLPNKKKGKRLPKELEIDLGKLITANQYASRNAMLSSLLIAWSPLLQLSSTVHSNSKNAPVNSFSILAVGGKSGNFSFWRIHAPQYYSVDQISVPTCVVLVGLLQAHSSWITAVNMEVLGSESSSQVLVASGSSDGSVKIWLGDCKDLLESSEAENAPFSLISEVVSENPVPISALSLAVSNSSMRKVFLAIGKGSGSLEVWACDISDHKFERVGLFDAHNHVVTGLAWAYSGHCLYSCSQDNYVHSWVFNGSSFGEVPIPSSTPEMRSLTDIPDVTVSCFGLAASVGSLVVAMVRDLDTEHLNPMYQVSAQKAIVEFFWIGGQQVALLTDAAPCDANDLVNWEANVIESLITFSDPNKPLVLWDIIAALSAFKQSLPGFVEKVLLKWLSDAYLGSRTDLSLDAVLACLPKSFSGISSRNLHLLNIISRRLMLSDMKADCINNKIMNLGRPGVVKEKQLSPWMELLVSSERELCQRLVDYSFSAFLRHILPSTERLARPGYWYPAGIQQMRRWVSLNHEHVGDHLKGLASEIEKLGKRLRRELEVEEQCSYCSASVPFDSPERTSCQGLKNANGAVENHQLVRCAVSMQVCPTTPLWFCKCCHRWISKLAPSNFFKMPSDHINIDSSLGELEKPFCPFCGILLQRHQPEFLLSASPV